MDFSNLDERELKNKCPYISIAEVQKYDIDLVGLYLSSSLQGFGIQNSIGGPLLRREHRSPPRDLWTEIKREFYLLLCTKARKYSNLRSQLNKKTAPTTTMIVSMISAAIAAQLGAAAGMITPLVALALYAILKLSLNSWCNIQKQTFKSE